MISCMSRALTAERCRIAQVAFVEFDVLLRQIARVKDAIVAAVVQENVKIEFGLGHNRAERSQADASRLSAPDCKNDLRLSGPAVPDIHFALGDLRGRIAHRAEN